MKKLCVFCGSADGQDTFYAQQAKTLGHIMVDEGIELVYGGGSIGLMGHLADTIMERGGKVTGVIPRFLYEKEVGHDGVSELIIVDSMHERKQTMANLAEGFMALPGGIGTLEELFEIFTWSQLNLIKKPVAVLNTLNYYNPLMIMLHNMVSEGFLSATTQQSLFFDDDPAELIIKMRSYKYVDGGEDEWEKIKRT